jgi:hypothetical protein
MVRVEDVARAVADAALAVPGVAGLSPGRGIEVSTQFAGGKVIGVRFTGDGVTVAIVADRVPLPRVAGDVTASVRLVLSAMGDGRPVTVVIDDVLPAALSRRSG